VTLFSHRPYDTAKLLTSNELDLSKLQAFVFCALQPTVTEGDAELQASAKAEDLLRVATRKYWPAMQDNIGMVALLLGFVLLLVIFLMYSIL
jgi:hypothetical protein